MRSLSCFLFHFGRDAYGYTAFRQVLYDYATRADNGPFANPSAWEHSTTNPQQSSILNFYLSSQVNPRCKMDIVAKPAIMVYGRAGIDNAMRPDTRLRLNHGAGEHNCSGSQDN